MNEQVLLQQLEILLVSEESPRLDREELKKLLAYVKSLERCLADALTLARGKNKLAA